MTDQKLTDLKNKVAELEKARSRYDGKLVIDQFCSLERVINRLDAILGGECETDAGTNEAWRCILSDEAANALDGLTQVRDELKERFTIDEYMESVKNKYAVKPEADDQPY